MTTTDEIYKFWAMLFFLFQEHCINRYRLLDGLAAARDGWQGRVPQLDELCVYHNYKTCTDIFENEEFRSSTDLTTTRRGLVSACVFVYPVGDEVVASIL